MSGLPKGIAGQLTVRGVVIGCIGCIVITAASVYTALKMGALPWPIVFAAIVSLFALKAMGSKSLNEANVTHTIMSAGAMVAGGLAFTIPGLWMLGYAPDVPWWQVLVVALAGVVLGLVCTAVLHKQFICEEQLEYPIGEAAAQTLRAGDAGGKTGAQLFGSMGISGIYTALRDGLGLIPTLLFGNISIPGVAFGIYNSPMMLAIGFMVGIVPVCVWFAGACLGNFGITLGGSTLGLWDVATGQGITASLGMGTMMGCGLAVICKDVLPALVRLIKHSSASRSEAAPAEEKADRCNDDRSESSKTSCAATAAQTLHIPLQWLALILAAVALALCMLLGLGPVPSVIVVLVAFVTCSMSAQSVGQTGIDPMEIFGLIILLILAAFGLAPQIQLFYVAAIIAVACGLAGDVMNDFHAGKVLGTDPRAQWIGQAIGAVLGAVVAVAVMQVLLTAYGADAFGPTKDFVAAQASVVATMITGIPSVPTFIIGLVLGAVLYVLRAPSMMLGLGIYLPFYMSATAFLGAVIHIVFNAICKHRLRSQGLSKADAEQQSRSWQDSALVVSSGVLGGESVVGIVIALIASLGMLA